MYVLTYKDKVFLGPKEWHPRMFQSVIEDDYDVVVNLPLADPNGRYDVSADIVIRPVEFFPSPNFNPKIERLTGPFYIMTHDTVIGQYDVEDLPIEAVKNSLKSIVSENRWKSEVSGLSFNIQGKDVFVPTVRGERDIFAQAFQLGADNVNWKFKEAVLNTGPNTTIEGSLSLGNDVWLILSNAEIGTIVQAIMNHVQTRFDWEGTKMAEIDACTTLAQLDVVVTDLTG